MSAIGTKLRPRIRSAFRRVGYEVHRLPTEPPSIAREPSTNTQMPQARQIIEQVSPAVVIDVGANSGEYAFDLREKGFAGEIVSFEPLPDAHAELVERAASDPLWIAAPRMALGDRPGTTEINVAGNSYSSSMLEMLALHASEAPGSAYVDKARCEVSRLDDALDRLGVTVTDAFLKIDTQGYEHQVLLGATRTLARCVAVQIEISLVPLYAGAVPTWKTIALLGEAGFDLAYTAPVFQAEDGRMLQIDGTFVRRD